MNPNPDPAASPCINVCKINDDQVCEGCHRTLDEIAVYSQLSDNARMHVNQRAAIRRSSDTTRPKP